MPPRERSDSPSPASGPEPHLTSRLEIRVRFCETDLMGIVHHANYLAYFEAGRVDWLRKRGVSYDSWTREDVHLPVIETHLRYRKSARFEDVLTIETTRLDLSRVTVRFGYRVMRGEELLCEGDTLLACVGQAMGARRMPPFVTAVMHAAEP